MNADALATYQEKEELRTFDIQQVYVYELVVTFHVRMRKFKPYI